MKKKQIHIRTNDSEYEKLKFLAKEKKMTITDYILENCLKENSPTVKFKIISEITKMQMSNFKIGNNINQIAKRVNSNKHSLSRTDFDNFIEVERKYKGILLQQNEMIKNLFKILKK